MEKKEKEKNMIMMVNKNLKENIYKEKKKIINLTF